MSLVDRIPPPGDAPGKIFVVIDTPKGSRNKYKWDEKLGALKLSHVLTAGAVFPFDFGFVPGTCGADGDALDVLVLTDEPLFPGCVAPARLIGSIEAEQTQEGKTLISIHDWSTDSQTATDRRVFRKRPTARSGSSRKAAPAVTLESHEASAPSRNYQENPFTL